MLLFVASQLRACFASSGCGLFCRVCFDITRFAPSGRSLETMSEVKCLTRWLYTSWQYPVSRYLKAAEIKRRFEAARSSEIAEWTTMTADEYHFKTHQHGHSRSYDTCRLLCQCLQVSAELGSLLTLCEVILQQQPIKSFSISD